MAGFLRVLEDEAHNARPSSQRQLEFDQSPLEVRMFNVGAGEAILLVFPGNRAWLIDGGATNSPDHNEILGQGLVDYLSERHLALEAFVPSHPHVDHVGGVATILDRGGAVLAPSMTIYQSDDPTWDLDRAWLNDLRAKIAALGSQVQVLRLRDAHREVMIADEVRAHLFAESGDGAYTSIFLDLRFRGARLLFTGDAHCPYEKELLDRFGEEDFRADVLKVTHHGSSSGTATRVVDAVRPGIAIASTCDDSGHTLELDTLTRLGGRPGPRVVYETLVDGDIILQTDGGDYRGGILYQVEFGPGAEDAEQGRAGHVGEPLELLVQGPDLFPQGHVPPGQRSKRRLRRLGGTGHHTIRSRTPENLQRTYREPQFWRAPPS